MSDSSTVDSLEATNYVNQQIMDLNRKLANKSNILPESISNLKIEESEGIHFGNVIYNFHHHLAKTGNLVASLLF